MPACPPPAAAAGVQTRRVRSSAALLPPACRSRAQPCRLQPAAGLQRCSTARPPCVAQPCALQARPPQPCRASADTAAPAAAWHVRPARANDVGAIATVLEECSSSWGARHVSEELARPIACVLVAARLDADADVAGVAVAWRVAGDCHVMELAVRPSARRRGLGSALLTAACAASCAPGGACLLELRESNAGAAKLYALHGFQMVGKRKKYYPNGEAALLMARAPGWSPEHAAAAADKVE